MHLSSTMRWVQPLEFALWEFSIQSKLGPATLSKYRTIYSWSVLPPQCTCHLGSSIDVGRVKTPSVEPGNGQEMSVHPSVTSTFCSLKRHSSFSLFYGAFWWLSGTNHALQLLTQKHHLLHLLFHCCDITHDSYCHIRFCSFWKHCSSLVCHFWYPCFQQLFLKSCSQSSCSLVQHYW